MNGHATGTSRRDARVLETSVRELKDVITQHNGTNAASRAFARRVDDLVSAFYDDIGEVARCPTRSLFDLFVIKVLYVERHSTDAGVIDYLGLLLDRFFSAQQLFSSANGGRPALPYFSDLLREAGAATRAQNVFEAYRKYGDSSLFVTGVFPKALRPHRRARRMRVAFVDRGYYVSTGKRSYRMATQHQLAESTEQRSLLRKLADYFEVYADALNEMSDRYIMGFDMGLIADKMLDNFNEYRRTGKESTLKSARRYASILNVEAQAFPSLMAQVQPRTNVFKTT